MGIAAKLKTVSTTWHWLTQPLGFNVCWMLSPICPAIGPRTRRAEKKLHTGRRYVQNQATDRSGSDRPCEGQWHSRIGINGRPDKLRKRRDEAKSLSGTTAANQDRHSKLRLCVRLLTSSRRSAWHLSPHELHPQVGLSDWSHGSPATPRHREPSAPRRACPV